jgi:peptide/nickel transport system ATP-binding protein/oligopeptide transport system ATP-binding protein
MLELKNVSKYFSIESKLFRHKTGTVTAADKVSFQINPNEILGLVGESGSGKTTLAKLITKLYKPDTGDILVDSKPINSYPAKKLASKIQMIFQDPFSSLNPRLSIGTIISEAAKTKQGTERSEVSLRKKVGKLLNTVGLPEDIVDNYPHQFSGGQRQRIAIARALAFEPELIIADEPVSCLDVSTQAQIINLFLDLKDKFGLSYLFISHDLMLINYLCDKILVMKEGRIVEQGLPGDIMNSPKNIYTKKLIDSARYYI